MSTDLTLRDSFKALMSELDSDILYKIGYVKGTNEVKVIAGMAQKKCGASTTAMVSCFEIMQSAEENNIHYRTGYLDAMEKGSASLKALLEEHDLYDVIK